MYPPTVLEAKSPKFSCPQGRALSEDRGEAFPCLFQLPVVPGNPGFQLRPPIPASVPPASPLLRLPPPLPLPFSHKARAVGFRVPLDDPGGAHGQVPNLIVSAKTLFPNTVTVPGST